MHQLYFLARIYPYWSIPASVLLAQLGLHFHRKRSFFKWAWWIAAVLLVVGFGLWIGYRGDLHSDQWMRAFQDAM
jgi:hypothetical protein